MTSINKKLKWTRQAGQHIAKGNGFEYRITDLIINGASWVLSIENLDTGITTDGGAYDTLRRAKEIAYSLDIR